MKKQFLFILSTLFSVQLFSQGKIVSVVNDSTELQQFEDGTKIKVNYLFNGNAVSLKDKDSLLAKGASYQQEFNIKNVGKEIVGEVNFLVTGYELPAKKDNPTKDIAPLTLNMLNNLRGIRFPDFDWIDIGGNKLSPETLKGKTMVFNFWHTSCIPCVAEMPLLNTVVEKYRNKAVVFIASTPNTEIELKKFLLKTAFKYEQVAAVDPKKIFDPMPGWPIHIVVDKTGVILFSALGKQNGIEEKLSRIIDQSLNTIK